MDRVENCESAGVEYCRWGEVNKVDRMHLDGTGDCRICREDRMPV